MRDILIDSAASIGAIVLAVLSFFINRNTLFIKILVSCFACGLGIYGIYSAFNKDAETSRLKKQNEFVKDEFVQIRYRDSLRAIHEFKLIAEIEDMRTAMKGRKMQYDPITKTITNNTINNFGLPSRAISENEIMTCVQAAFGNIPINKLASVELFVQGTVSGSKELEDCKKRIIEILSGNGFKNIIQHLHYEDFGGDKVGYNCIYIEKINTLQIRFQAYP